MGATKPNGQLASKPSEPTGRPAVSVVVLVYNSARTVAACLSSLSTQRQPAVEVLVVDDDSTDGTLDIVAEVAKTTGLPVRVLRNGAHNISRGRNIGIAAAKTSVVAFLDSDATAEPSWLAELARRFAAADSPAVVGGEVVASHATSFAAAIAVNDGTVRELFARGRLLVNGCNMAVHTERSGGALFAEDWVHAEDIEFLTRACEVHPWALATQAAVRHESRATPRAYLRQMYRYGDWKVRYTLTAGDARAVDFVPTAVGIASIAVSVWTLWALLALPALCVAETAFVATYRCSPARLLPLMLAGWIVKNAGWGAGVAVGLSRMIASALKHRLRILRPASDA